MEIKKGQWKVRCYELTKKDDYEGFSLNDLGDGKSKTAYDDKETVTWNQVEMTENRDVIQKNDIVDVTCSAFYKGKEVPINYVGIMTTTGSQCVSAVICTCRSWNGK